MSVVWKTHLELIDYQTIELPCKAKFLTAQMQKDKLQLWYLCEPGTVTQKRRIAIYGTGHNISALPDEVAPTAGDYISTIQLCGGDLIFHVFDKGRVN